MARVIEAAKRFLGLGGQVDDVSTLGQHWPPMGDAERIKRYQDNYAIWKGEHERVLVSNDVTLQGQYLVFNVAKNIVTVCADLLFGEELKYDFGDASDEDADRVREIIERNKLQQLFYEASLDTQYSGDGVFVVGRDEDNGPAVIRTIPAEHWFPTCNPDNVREILQHTLAWEKEVDKQKLLRAIEHLPGEIHNKLYVLKGGKITGEASPAQWAAVFNDKPPKETIQTGVDDFLVVHVPNFRTARELFGRDEYADVLTLFGAINARLTQEDGILDRHSDPTVALPYDVWLQVTKGGSSDVDPADLGTVALGANGEVPQYITWDGQLAANQAFIDKLIHLIGVVTETAPQLLHSEQWGGDFSGRALRILLLRTLAKVNRKRLYFDHAIKELLRLAQLVEGVEPIEVSVIWPDGLPQDVNEQVDLVDRRLANRTMSRKAAVMRLDDKDEGEADEVLDEVAEEDGADVEMVAARNPAPPGGAPTTIPVKVSLPGAGE